MYTRIVVKHGCKSHKASKEQTISAEDPEASITHTVTLKDEIRSEEIRKLLQTQNLVEDIRRHQIKLLEHVERMSAGRLITAASKQTFVPVGRRDIGRLRERWREQFQ